MSNEENMSFSNTVMSSVRLTCVKLRVVFRMRTTLKSPEMGRNRERSSTRLLTLSELQGSDHKTIEESDRRLTNSSQSLMGD